MILWKETSRELVLKSALFRLFKVGFRSEKSGKEGRFDVLESKSWVNVLAITPRKEAILVEQFRYGSAESSLEFPAGSIEEGQTPLETARRELAEETGGTCAVIEEIGSCRPNPAILNNWCYHFLAENVEITQAQSLDENEELEMKLVPLERIDKLIASGKITHSLTIATWYFYRSRARAFPTQAPSE
jgi:8-oxo-dGTP pyrophosphatase MutT (NUDIX family)